MRNIKTKTPEPYIRAHKVVDTFNVFDYIYKIVKFSNTQTYGIVVTDTLTGVTSLFKGTVRMDTVEDVAYAFRSAGRFKEAIIVESDLAVH